MGNLDKSLEKAVLFAQMEAQQRSLEGISYSIGIHIILLIICLNFGKIEMRFGLADGTKGKLAKGPIEITVFEEHVQVPTVEPVLPPPVNQEVVTEKIEDKDAIIIPQQKIQGLEEFKLQMAELARQQKEKQELEKKVEEEKRKVAAVEYQKKVQAEIEDSRRKAREKIDKEMQETNLNASGSGGEEDEDEAISGGGGGFVINVHEYADHSDREPCPSGEVYYNPGNECKAYTQRLYKPLCYYDYKTCLKVLRKLKRVSSK